MQLSQLKNKKILILGFGKEGVSSYKYMRRYFKVQKISITDAKNLNQFNEEAKKILKTDENLKLYLGKKYLKNFSSFDIIIKTPGIALNKNIIATLKKKNIKLTSNLNIFLSNTRGKIIGVSGSKGKSTTSTLIYKILKNRYNKVFLVGNIGQPFLNYIGKDSKNTIYVAELSSFHLEQIEGSINIGILTSFFGEHLEVHGTLNNYFNAKMNLVRHIKKDGVIIYNKRYKKIANFIKKVDKKLSIQAIAAQSGKTKIDSLLVGKHNQDNIALAIEVAKLFKINKKIYFKIIKNFKGLENRLEFVGQHKGILFYNDSAGTNPETAVKSIEALKKINLQTLIVGGLSKGGNYKLLANEIIKSKIRTLVVLPNIGKLVQKEMKHADKKYNTNIVKALNMKEAVKLAYMTTKKNEVVVLSPAGTSFDFYKNYVDRGMDYKKWIKKLK